MKIELGESLVRTWVRHCRGCQLAELNWKPSPKWRGEPTPEHERWYGDAVAQFPAKVFKKNSGLKQFLAQAEIDVLGVRFADGQAEKLIAADIAFHTNGLQYGPNEDTEARITKKLFRTALTLHIHFPGAPAEIVFLSPKVNPGRIPLVGEARDRVQTFFDRRGGGFVFRTLINGEFRTEVLDAVLPLHQEVADTSELFLRAAQLLGLFPEAAASCRPSRKGPGRARRRAVAKEIGSEMECGGEGEEGPDQ